MYWKKLTSDFLSCLKMQSVVPSFCWKQSIFSTVISPSSYFGNLCVAFPVNRFGPPFDKKMQPYHLLTTSSSAVSRLKPLQQFCIATTGSSSSISSSLDSSLTSISLSLSYWYCCFQSYYCFSFFFLCYLFLFRSFLFHLKLHLWYHLK